MPLDVNIWKLTEYKKNRGLFKMIVSVDSDENHGTP